MVKTVEGGEGPTTEFKRKAKYPYKILKEFSAFANTSGGVVLLGVADDKTIPGLKSPDEEAFIMEDAITKGMEPRPDFEISTIEVAEDRWVLVYTVKEGLAKPYFVSLGEDGTKDPNNPELKAYIRRNDECLQASRELREVLKMKASGKTWHFEYGIKEKMLVEYLKTNSFITLRGFGALAGVDKRSASRTLVLLTVCGLLDLEPHETEDLYTLAPTQ